MDCSGDDDAAEDRMVHPIRYAILELLSSYVRHTRLKCIRDSGRVVRHYPYEV
jgi:hypothetical protein